ncbi:hypothetical protein EB235_19940 [Mesorhizobium loti R88b]|uniref:Uncharacterized protein n=1 Tax=Mesorhizobium loti R88b TaxID=935548 RepID=A0A6M7WWH5_RHILI|nr:hypothetical protein EB235_19940 [Mesorhizobium loti R88b]
MTLTQRSNDTDKATEPANDNHDVHIARLLDAALTDEENIADLVRRTERTAMLVLIGMGGWLMLVPAIYVVLTHGI